MAILLLSVEPLVKNKSVLSMPRISARLFLEAETMSLASVPNRCVRLSAFP